MPTTIEQMNISMTPQLARYIRGKVKSGRYNNASEVVREAVRKMEEMEARERFLTDPPNARAEVRKGLESIRRGDYIELSGDAELEEFFQDIAARGKKRLETRDRKAGR